MGTQFNFVCFDCKQVHELGYGSYTTWLYKADTLAKYDALPADHKTLNKNIALRKCLQHHDGHQIAINEMIYWLQKDDGIYQDGVGYTDDYLIYPSVDLSKFTVLDIDFVTVTGCIDVHNQSVHIKEL